MAKPKTSCSSLTLFLSFLPVFLFLTVHAKEGSGSGSQTFAITEDVAVEIRLDTFSMCFHDTASPSPSPSPSPPLLCTTPEKSLDSGEWLGFNLQKYIYEGYSIRIGRTWWFASSNHVQSPIEYDKYDESLTGKRCLLAHWTIDYCLTNFDLSLLFDLCAQVAAKSRSVSTCTSTFPLKTTTRRKDKSSQLQLQLQQQSQEGRRFVIDHEHKATDTSWQRWK